MFKMITLIATYLIGKSLNPSHGGHGPSPFLFRLPLLIIRKILKLFLVGFGSLLVGVLGIGFLIRDLLYQVQTQSQILLTPATGISLVVVIAGFALCAWTLSKKNWVDAGDLTVPVEPVVAHEAHHPSDAVTAIINLISEMMNQKADRRSSSAV